jgi:hypothetical protein
MPGCHSSLVIFGNVEFADAIYDVDRKLQRG